MQMQILMSPCLPECGGGNPGTAKRRKRVFPQDDEAENTGGLNGLQQWEANTRQLSFCLRMISVLANLL